MHWKDLFCVELDDGNAGFIQVVFHGGRVLFRTRNDRRSDDHDIGSSEFNHAVFADGNVVHQLEDLVTWTGDDNDDILAVVAVFFLGDDDIARDLVVAHVVNHLEQFDVFLIIEVDLALVFAGKLQNFHNAEKILPIQGDQKTAFAFFKVMLDMIGDSVFRCGVAYPVGTAWLRHQNQNVFLPQIGQSVDIHWESFV